MPVRKPLLEVRNAGGIDVLPRLGGLWKSVSTTEHAGKKSDEATITCVGPPSRVAMPPKGFLVTILMGWADEGLVEQGTYTFQKPKASGTPEEGDLVDLTFRAADFVDKLKAQGREHYDDITYGDLIQKLAGKAGLGAAVDPALASVQLGYRVRWDQSIIDFATEVSEQVGATVKPMAGKLVAMKRGGGTSGGGQALDPILIARHECSTYEFDLDARPDTGKVAAAWQDPKTGKRKFVTKSTGHDGPTAILRHPFVSEDVAGDAADASGYEHENASGSGSVTTWGRPQARAEAPTSLTGFGSWIDGPWKTESLEKKVDVEGGFETTVHVTAGKDQKEKTT